jgi:hypothetical protein
LEAFGGILGVMVFSPKLFKGVFYKNLEIVGYFFSNPDAGTEFILKLPCFPGVGIHSQIQ